MVHSKQEESRKHSILTQSAIKQWLSDKDDQVFIVYLQLKGLVQLNSHTILQICLIQIPGLQREPSDYLGSPAASLQGTVSQSS